MTRNPDKLTFPLTIHKLLPSGAGEALLERPLPHPKAQPLLPLRVEIPFTLPGDQVIATVNKRRRPPQGWLMEVAEPSSMRIEPRCMHAAKCGGCGLQQMDYAAQTAWKEEEIKRLFTFAPDTHFEPILVDPSPWHYRGKMEFTFGMISKEGGKGLGFIRKGTKGSIVPIQECFIGPPWALTLLRAVDTWWQGRDAERPLWPYRMRDNTGHLRTLTIRSGVQTGQKMAILTVSGHPDYALTRADLDTFVQAAEQAAPGISLFLRIHQLLKGQPTQFYEIHLAGPTHIEEKLHLNSGTFSFKISPTSFFQPNPKQAEQLINLSLEAADLKPHHTLFDLYCGTCVFGIAASPLVRKVIGIEVVPEAILDAEDNLRCNEISNVELHCGDVAKILQNLIASEGFTAPDVVFVDPPRMGLSPEALGHLLTLAPKKIIYISCNPKTQALDIAQLLQKGYQLLKIHPVDQFPHTPHCENLAVLQKTWHP